MRVLKTVGLTLVILLTLFCNAVHGKDRKIKVYMDAPNEIGQNEGFSLHLMEQMRLADYDDDNYEFVWIKKAIEADYIITVIADRNPFQVAAKVGNVTNVCRQFIVTVVIDRIVEIRAGEFTRRGVDPDKTHYMVNQQVDCDPDEIARRAVVEMLVAMGLKPGVLTKR